MATDEKWHSMVTESIGGAEAYGRGIWPNPWVEKQAEWKRREDKSKTIMEISRKIKMIFEPRFLTGVETCELMEALISMTGATQILELGMCTGFGSLHMLRAIVGKPGAGLISIDARPAHDRDFFAQIKEFQFVQGWTPDALEQLHGRQFDFVFVDSDHSVAHTEKELAALMPITHPGSMICFHDCPEWQTPSNPNPPPVREYLLSLIKSGEFSGMMLPSPAQLDCEEEYGKGYDNRCNPGLAVLIRK
jgi:predicted O-methyltransferase YrrM